MCQRVAIRAEGLSKALGTRNVLRGVNLAISTGECVLLRGDNGTGKTTLLRCLAGLVRPDAGSVRWFERSPLETTAHRLIGLVAHESHLYPHLTLRENLVITGRLHDVSGPTHRASQWLEAAGLNEHADRLPREVSQGMRRRTSLARALVHEPPILLLDEPYSGLDQAGGEWLCEVLLERRRQGQTTCLVTHEDATTRHLADRVLQLRSGRLWASTRTLPDRETDACVAASVSPRACPTQVTA
jgi:heme exporter protein A